jgi:hypothetical protein
VKVAEALLDKKTEEFVAQYELTRLPFDFLQEN